MPTPNGNGKRTPSILKSFIYQKFICMAKKRTEEGGYPRTRLEENMARDFRLCRSDVKKIFEELHLGNLDERHKVKKKKSTRALPEYSQQSEDDFLNDLKTYQ